MLFRSLSYQYTEGQSIGIAPLLAYQRFQAYGLQAFEGLSQAPDAVTNNGYEGAFGAGVRVGWYGQLRPWLSLGAAYSTRVYMQNFETYRGLLAGNGDFDIPQNYSVGVALKVGAPAFAVSTVFAPPCAVTWTTPAALP